MDASNLATLFAPNILHKPIKELSSNDLSDEMTIERRYAIDVITTLIVNYEYLFKVIWNADSYKLYTTIKCYNLLTDKIKYIFILLTKIVQ